MYTADVSCWLLKRRSHPVHQVSRVGGPTASRGMPCPMHAVQADGRAPCAPCPTRATCTTTKAPHALHLATANAQLAGAGPVGCTPVSMVPRGYLLRGLLTRPPTGPVHYSGHRRPPDPPTQLPSYHVNNPYTLTHSVSRRPLPPGAGVVRCTACCTGCGCLTGSRSWPRREWGAAPVGRRGRWGTEQAGAGAGPRAGDASWLPCGAHSCWGQTANCGEVVHGKAGHIHKEWVAATWTHSSMLWGHCVACNRVG